MACESGEQTWLDMAILDLHESKKTEAVALEQARTLQEEKELLVEKLKLQHDLWDLEKQQLEEALASTMKEHKGRNIAQTYEIAALHVSLGSYQQQALVFKLRLEGAVDEVEILSSRLQFLSVQLQEKDAQFSEAHEKYLEREACLKQRLATEKPPVSKIQPVLNAQCLDKLKRKHELEVEKLKNEQQALSLRRNEEVSALLREKNFVWDQMKRMENDFSSRLSTKRQELKCAEETLQRLQVQVAELQKAHDEKTVENTVLRINVQAVEEELCKLQENLLKLNPSGQGTSHLDLVMKNAGLSLMKNSDRHMATSCDDEAQPSTKEHAVLTFNDSEATKLLAEKEEELKKARKFMDELRLENQNLRLLYADLEEQLKEKQKPEGPSRDNAKDATFRNLDADLEAVATTGQTSPKACAELKRRRLIASETCAQGDTSQTLEQLVPINGDGSHTMEISLKEPSNEVKAIDLSQQSLIRMSQQSVESRSDLSSTGRPMKNRLFSSVFGIPKVLAGT